MIESPDFAKTYKSSTCLAVSEEFTQPAPQFLYKVCEVEDRDAESKNTCKEAFNFNFPRRVPIYTSVKGLLLMRDYYWDNHSMYVCNPVTREYITITSPKYTKLDVDDSYAFGVSRDSGLFKVVRIFDQLTSEEVGCQVYIVGTGLWRSVDRDNESLVYKMYAAGVFLNGNIHWPASDKKGGLWISCFDLETELFTILHAPRALSCSLCAVRDCLGIGDYSSRDEIVIWLMKHFGDDKSWSKQFVIPKMDHDISRLIHVFKDGDILFKEFGKRTSCYSNKTKALEETTDLKLHEYGPSFLPLKTFSSTENVTSFCSKVYSF